MYNLEKFVMVSYNNKVNINRHPEFISGSPIDSGTTNVNLTFRMT